MWIVRRHTGIDPKQLCVARDAALFRCKLPGGAAGAESCRGVSLVSSADATTHHEPSAECRLVSRGNGAVRLVRPARTTPVPSMCRRHPTARRADRDIRHRRLRGGRVLRRRGEIAGAPSQASQGPGCSSSARSPTTRRDRGGEAPARGGHVGPGPHHGDSDAGLRPRSADRRTCLFSTGRPRHTAFVASERAAASSRFDPRGAPQKRSGDVHGVSPRGTSSPGRRRLDDRRYRRGVCRGAARGRCRTCRCRGRVQGLTMLRFPLPTHGGTPLGPQSARRCGRPSSRA